MRKVLLIFALLGLAVSAAGQEAAPQRRNPLLAGALSWYSAGLGQMYTGDYLKGGVFFVVDNALLLLALNAVAEVNLVVNENLGTTLNVRWRDRRSVEYNAARATFYLVSYAVFHSYNVFDAVHTALRKNLGHEPPVFRGRVEPLPADDGLALVWRTGF